MTNTENKERQIDQKNISNDINISKDFLTQYYDNTEISSNFSEKQIGLFFKDISTQDQEKFGMQILL